MEKRNKRFIKTMAMFIKESAEVDKTYIETIEFDDETLTIHKIADSPLKTQFYANTLEGESYIDISKILSDNMLIDAVWIEKGGDEERIADKIDCLSKTDKTTKAGFKTFIIYKINK
jgi:hypothetical protein